MESSFYKDVTAKQNNLEFMVRSLFDQIHMMMEDYGDAPGSFVVGRVLREKPPYEHYELLRKVQKLLPECGFEITHDIVLHKSIYILEWRVHF